MKIGIVGGGITGLVTANELSNRKDCQVVLFEKSKECGGVVGSFKTKGWPLEIFYHHYFSADEYLREYLEELGLKNKLFFKRPQTSIYIDGQIYPFDTPKDLLDFPVLRLFDKLRMGAVIFFFKKLPYLNFFEKKTVVNLLPKLVGVNAWETIWKNLMEKKFSRFTDEVSFSWFWARLKSRTRELGYLKGGTDVLVDKLVKRINKKNQIRTNSLVKKIRMEADKIKVVMDNKKTFSFDKLVLTVPLPEVVNLLGEKNKKVKSYSGLKSVGALTLILKLKNNFFPGQTYWLNVLGKNFPFVVAVEHTNFIDKSNYGGEHILYVGGYYDKSDKIFDLSKQEVFDQFAPYLRRLNPSFDKDVIDFEIFKNKHAQPVVPTNYSQLRPDYEIVPRKVWIATPNHIFPWDRGINYSIKLGQKIASLV